jgi:hypothetical protein
MFSQVIFLIILLIIILVVLSSVGYSGNETVEIKQVSSKKLPTFIPLKPSLVNNCTLVHLDNVSKKRGFYVTGNFTNSCLSIYENNQRIHSRILNGDQYMVFVSNLNIVSKLFNSTKLKSLLLPIKEGFTYDIVVNNVNNLEAGTYSTDLDIEAKDIQYQYELGNGINEYDLYKKFLSENLFQKSSTFKRVPLSPISGNFWGVKGPGDFYVTLIDGVYDLNVTLNGQEFNLRKTNNFQIISTKLKDIKIKVENLEQDLNSENIHKDYIDFITAPSRMIQKFLYDDLGKKINYTSLVNNKIFILRL